MPALPHPSDVDLFGLAVAGDGQSGDFVLDSGLVRHDGALYGGTGLAVSIAAMEAATERHVLWCSTQFVSQPFRGDTITWEVERLAVGKRAAQLLVRASANDETAFVAIGSTGIAAADGLTGQYVPVPAVTTPEGSPARMRAMPVDLGEDSWAKHIEMRDAELLGPGPTVALWARRRDGGPVTPAVLAFIADFVPLGVARAAGKMGAGASLDNSMRFRGGVADTEWVLIELLGELAYGGFGHGSLRAWSEDGVLLATGSQSASMKYLFDEGDMPNLPQPPTAATAPPSA
jgi:acyl-CoA thioesterase